MANKAVIDVNVVIRKSSYFFLGLDVFFDKTIEVRNSLVSLPMLVALCLFVYIFQGASWMKVISACLDICQLVLVAGFIKFFRL